MGRRSQEFNRRGRIAGALAGTVLSVLVGDIGVTNGVAAGSAATDSIPQAPIRVKGTRFTLREIIRRCHEGERTKLGERRSVTYTMTIRNIARWKDKTKTEETVFRAYADQGGHNRTVLLDQKVTTLRRDGDTWVADDEAEDEPPPVRISTSGIDEFTSIPFFLEDEREYDFTLLERRLEENQVIFKIAFEPKSDFKPLPSGVVYVDTDHYRIIHEEFHFDKNPFPLFLKGVRRISRHWGMLPGGEWVFTKLMIEAELRGAPFGMLPSSVSAALLRSDFQFDGGYDPHLFGKSDDLSGQAARATPAPVETPETRGDFLLKLQREDEDFFPEDLFAVDPLFRERVVAQHDSLGIEAFQDAMDRRVPALRMSMGAADQLWDYNRVEGLVAGGSWGLRTRRGERGPQLSIHGAYAVGSEAFRHREALLVPLGSGSWRTELGASYRDRVEPYGSNRPTLNAVRALIGGADERDYLRAEGGQAGLSVSHKSGMALEASYTADRFSSVDATTKFSALGDLWEPNDAIDAGSERAVSANLKWRPTRERRLTASIEQRVAGGGLGGDFNYARSDVTIDWRHFWLGRHEVASCVRYARTEGRVPVQRLPDAGGLSTVRGYARRTLVGESVLAARLEYLVPYDILGAIRVPVVGSLGLQIVPWFDLARTWHGNREEWIHSAGFGVQVLLGVFGRASNLRLDVAFPTAADRPEDVRVYLGFSPGNL